MYSCPALLKVAFVGEDRLPGGASALRVAYPDGWSEVVIPLARFFAHLVQAIFYGVAFFATTL